MKHLGSICHCEWDKPHYEGTRMSYSVPLLCLPFFVSMFFLFSSSYSFLLPRGGGGWWEQHKLKIINFKKEQNNNHFGSTIAKTREHQEIVPFGGLTFHIAIKLLLATIKDFTPNWIEFLKNILIGHIRGFIQGSGEFIAIQFSHNPTSSPTPLDESCSYDFLVCRNFILKSCTHVIQTFSELWTPMPLERRSTFWPSQCPPCIKFRIFELYWPKECLM